MGLRLASSRHKNKVCQQVSFCVEFARLLYVCRFLCQCGCEWLPVCVSHRLATYRGCAPPLAPRPLERLQPLCNPKLYKKKKINGWLTFQRDRGLKDISQESISSCLTKKGKEKALASKELLKSWELKNPCNTQHCVRFRTILTTLFTTDIKEKSQPSHIHLSELKHIISDESQQILKLGF